MKGRDNAGLFVALGAAVILWLYSRTQSGASAISAGTGMVLDTTGRIVTQIESTVRGIRNNNPGNIRRSSVAWVGLAPVQDDPDFFQFADIRYGIRAMGKILLSYFNKYGLDTVTKIINRWAPPSENATGAYIDAVAASVGVDPDQSIDLTDPVVMGFLIDAIITQENGRVAAALVSTTAIDDGVQLAYA
jgi:hypothetical protein